MTVACLVAQDLLCASLLRFVDSGKGIGNILVLIQFKQNAIMSTTPAYVTISG